MSAVSIEGKSKAPKKSVLAGALAQGKPIDYGEDAETSKPVEGVTLDALRTMCQEMLNLEAEIATRNEATKKLEKQLADLQENRLPKVMEQSQLPEFRFKDARTGIETIIRIKDDIRVQLPTMPKGKAFVRDPEACKPLWGWFREHGMSALLIKEVVMPVRHLNDDQIGMLIAQVKELDPTLDAAVVEDINAQTLKATVKRIREEGKLQLPEAIKVTPIKQAKTFAK
jgi:hypothetical protein